MATQEIQFDDDVFIASGEFEDDKRFSSLSPAEEDHYEAMYREAVESGRFH